MDCNFKKLRSSPHIYTSTSTQMRTHTYRDGLERIVLAAHDVCYTNKYCCVVFLFEFEHFMGIFFSHFYNTKRSNINNIRALARQSCIRTEYVRRVVVDLPLHCVLVKAKRPDCMFTFTAVLSFSIMIIKFPPFSHLMRSLHSVNAVIRWNTLGQFVLLFVCCSSLSIRIHQVSLSLPPFPSFPLFCVFTSFPRTAACLHSLRLLHLWQYEMEHSNTKLSTYCQATPYDSYRVIHSNSSTNARTQKNGLLFIIIRKYNNIKCSIKQAYLRVCRCTMFALPLSVSVSF